MSLSKNSDAFFFLPGGLGTLQEMFLVLSCTQLDLHKKRESLKTRCHHEAYATRSAIVILNVRGNTGGIYHHFMGLVNTLVEEGFIEAKCSPEKLTVLVEECDAEKHGSWGAGACFLIVEKDAIHMQSDISRVQWPQAVA